MMQRVFWTAGLCSVLLSAVVAQQAHDPSKTSLNPFQPVPAGAPIPFEPFPMVDPATGKPVSPDTVLVFPDGTKVTAKDFYASLNALEKSLNALGYSLKKNRNVFVPSRSMNNPQELMRQQEAFEAMVYPDGVPTPGPETGDFSPAGGFNVPWNWDSNWLGNDIVGARAALSVNLAGDIAPINFTARAEGSGRVRLWGQEREVIRGVADARLQPTSATNLRFTAFAELYVNGQRQWGWPENGPFTHNFTTGVHDEVTGDRAIELWNFGPDPAQFSFDVWIIHISGELGARGKFVLDYHYSAGLNAVGPNYLPGLEAGITPRFQFSANGSLRAEVNTWVLGLWAGLRGQVNVATWRMPAVAGIVVGQENGRYYAERYIRARSEARDVLKGRLDWYAGVRLLFWTWETGGELFSWPGFNHSGNLINWSSRHYF